MEARPARQNPVHGRPGSLIRVIVAEPHPVLRKGIAALLAEEDSIRVIGEGGLEEQALREITSLHPDVVVVAAGPAATESVRQIRERSPVTQVVMVVAVDEDIPHAGHLAPGDIGPAGAELRQPATDANLFLRPKKNGTRLAPNATHTGNSTPQ